MPLVSEIIDQFKDGDLLQGSLVYPIAINDLSIKDSDSELKLVEVVQSLEG